MVNPYKPSYPPQENIPSQQVPNRTPYAPGQPQAAEARRQQEDHPQAAGSPPSVYVVSTFDARPINAVDFNTQSGNDPRDVGFQPFATPPDPVPPYSIGSTFYTVGSGRVLVVREWQALVVPSQGELVTETEPPSAGNPIFSPLGASNTKFTIGFFIDGNPQEGMSPIVTWATPFGDVFGECYIIVEEGQTVEMRITGTVGGSLFTQALLAFHGNLLLSKGKQAQYEPATDAVLPVHEGGG
jgi:hypothetical protein